MGWLSSIKDGVGSVARSVGGMGADVARGVGHAGAEVLRTQQDLAMRPLQGIAGLAGLGAPSFGSAFSGQGAAANPGEATDQMNGMLDGVLQFIQKLLQMVGVGNASPAQPQPQAAAGGSSGGDVHIVVNR